MNNPCSSYFNRCPVRSWRPCPLWKAPPLLLQLALPDPSWGMDRFDDPEDSPLFTDSMQKAFEQFAARDISSLTARDTRHHVRRDVRQAYFDLSSLGQPPACGGLCQCPKQ